MIKPNQSVKAATDRLCEVGAKAVQRYAEVSGLDPNTYLPECFIQSYVLEYYGATMRMETRLSDLIKWSGASLEEHVTSPSVTDPVIHWDGGNPRIDLVLYDDNGQPKDRQDIFALIEIKSGYLSNDDRNKLAGLLPFVPVCSAAIVCGQLRESQLSYERQQFEMLKKPTDVWKEKPFTVDGRNFAFAAHAFGLKCPDD